MSQYKVVIASAHPDDFELGMAMRARKYADDGAEITAITATRGEYSDSPTGRHNEEKKAAKILGIKNLINLSLPCAQLSNNVLVLRSEIEKIIKKVKPDIGYTIHPDQLHVDHEILSRQSLVAYRSIPEVIYYKATYIKGFVPNLFFFGNKRLLDIKMKALRCFSSEIKKSGTVDVERIKSLSKFEHHNYLHHSGVKQIESKMRVSHNSLFTELFHIERLISY
jgi:LmbE family N-acetylglucosaminyl deacetylase